MSYKLAAAKLDGIEDVAHGFSRGALHFPHSAGLPGSAEDRFHQVHVVDSALEWLTASCPFPEGIYDLYPR